MKCVDELPQLAPEASKSTNCGKQKSENKMDALQRHLLDAAIKNKKIKKIKKERFIHNGQQITCSSRDYGQRCKNSKPVAADHQFWHIKWQEDASVKP